MEIPSQMASEELQRALAGRFSLQRELGRGGMGIVFLAQDVILNRPVAIKLLAPAMCEVPALRTQFLREAHLAAACFHPHIVPVYEVGESETQAWYVMAWVQGETLADRLLRSRTLPATQVHRIAREIGWALAYAHEHGLVHRDIKPANILLEEGSGRAMLVDFGIALSTEQGEQNHGAGTAQFMAPEQLAGLSVDGRTDLYSLGVTLHLAATGRFPNTAADHADAGHAAPSPSGALRLSSRLPPTLSNAISRCLAPDPLNRFDSATAFLKEIASEESPAILSTAAIRVRDNYRNTLSLAGWAAVIGITGLALATGEEAHSFARGLTMQFSLLIASITASMAALRGIETIASIRRAVREGLSKRELERALTPPTAGEIENPSENGKAMFPPWAKSCLLLSTAVAVAMLQAPIGSWQSVPDSLQAVLQVIAVALPAVLIHRGFKTIIETTARSKRFGTGIAKKLASGLHRWFARGTGTYTNETASSETLSGEALSVQEMENAPTEIRLGEANAALINRLAPDTTLALPNLRDAAVQLTRYATQLRNRERELAGLTGVTDQRAQIRSRMTTVIAALETMRLDLLRVEHQKTLSAGLTDPFETVKHLQRYVDAMDEIRRSIAQPSLP